MSEFIVAWLFCTFPLLRPAPLSAAWHFGHFLPPVPRTALWRVAFSSLIFSCAPPRSLARGFLDAFFLLRPAPLLGAWLIQHFLAPAPRSSLGCVAFSALIFSCAPPHSRGRGLFGSFPLLRPASLFGAWLFSLFLASAPRLALSPRGLFRHSLLLCPKYKFAPVMQQF